MKVFRRSKDRGHFEYDWLNTYHTFSFGDYYDPKWMGFRSLRVINEDRVQPGLGFPTHSHQNMEILTYVIEGALQHRDSMGNSSIIRPGEVQRMSAGTGVTHSEFNASESEPVHFLQIWILPQKLGQAPSYEQAEFPLEERQNHWRLVASPDGQLDSVVVHQDMRLYLANLEAHQNLRFSFDPGRAGWLQVVKGEVRLGDELLHVSDGVALTDEEEISIFASQNAEVFLFDLP